MTSNLTLIFESCRQTVTVGTSGINDTIVNFV